MPGKTDTILGALKVAGLLEETCVESINDLIKLLPNVLQVQIPASVSNVTIGVEQPGDTERDNLWIRLDTASSFVGIYIYSVGQWRQIYPIADGITTEVFWVVGDSRKPPKGFTAALDSTELSTSQKNFIKTLQHWHNDAVNTYYDYYAVLYTGF